jgi:hypothetical protein
MAIKLSIMIWVERVDSMGSQDTQTKLWKIEGMRLRDLGVDETILIKLNLNKQGVDSNQPAPNRIQWRNLVNTVINLHVQ